MKKNILLLIIFTCILSLISSAQSPQLINYQAVVRDANGQLVANGTTISLKFIIHDVSSTGTVVFTETQKPVVNQFGLVSVKIGIISNLAVVNWSNGAKYLEVDLDITGGTNFTNMGTTQLLSVPYALFAANSEPGPTGQTGAIGATGATGSNGLQSGNFKISGVTQTYNLSTLLGYQISSVAMVGYDAEILTPANWTFNPLTQNLTILIGVVNGIQISFIYIK